MTKSATESGVRAVWSSDVQRERSLTHSARSMILRDYGIYIILVIITLAFSVTTKGFATINNLILILLQVSVMGIISVGMLFVILSKGIDLSVGSTLAIAGMFSGLLAKQEPTPVNVALALGVPLFLGLACGLVNGYLTPGVACRLDRYPWYHVRLSRLHRVVPRQSRSTSFSRGTASSDRKRSVR